MAEMCHATIENSQALSHAAHSSTILNMVPAIPCSSGIPKIIHQTYFSRTELPRELEENIELIKAKNPGWEHRFYDDDEIVRFIQQEYGNHMLSYFQRINPAYGAAKADLFRYLCLYKCGGVYIDIKSALNLPLDDVIRPDDQYLLSYWQNDQHEPFYGWGLHPALMDYPRGEFQQWHIVSAAGHPFLRSVIKDVLHNIEVYHPLIHGVGRKGVLSTTGPIAYTLAIGPLLNKYPHRIVDIDADAGFQYSLYQTDRGFTHKSLFKSHYTTLRKPVIKIGFLQKMALPFLKLARKFRRLSNPTPANLPSAESNIGTAKPIP